MYKIGLILQKNKIHMPWVKLWYLNYSDLSILINGVRFGFWVELLVRMTLVCFSLPAPLRLVGWSLQNYRLLHSLGRVAVRFVVWCKSRLLTCLIGLSKYTLGISKNVLDLLYDVMHCGMTWLIGSPAIFPKPLTVLCAAINADNVPTARAM